MDVFSRKKQLRERLLRQRRSLPEPKRRRLSAAICENLLSLSELAAAKTVLSYLPAGGEADVGALNELLQKNGAAVAFPVCGSDGSMEAYLPEAPDAFVVGIHGIPEPDPRRARRIPPEELDAVIAPCVAFSPDCRRLGRGRGYYDRYLPRCKNAFTAAAGYGFQKTEHLPADEADVSLHAAADESRVYRRPESRKK